MIAPNVYSKLEELSLQFQEAVPFPHVIIDGFLDESLADKLIRDFPEISKMYRSHHYLFANKYELSFWNKTSNSFELLHQELISNKFQSFIRKISNENLFMPSDIYGDLHQGTNGGFLDMHVDFNIHPNCETWLHRLNVIIYLNKDWKKAYGGELQLRDGLEGNIYEIPPLFNRCVIFRSDDTSYHGYKQLSLPRDVTRKAVLANFYKDESPDKLPPKHPTIFAPGQESIFKSTLAKLYNPVAILKRRLFGAS